jgi:endonuclease YncB( thermonuclease family)
MAIRVTNDGFSSIGASVAIDDIPDSRDRVKLAEIGLPGDEVCQLNKTKPEAAGSLSVAPWHHVSMRILTIALILLATPALADMAGVASVIDGDTNEVHGQRIRPCLSG